MAKPVYSVRIPDNIYNYYKKKGKSLGKVLMEKYNEDQKNELPILLKEIKIKKEEVLQLERKVILAENECHTEKEICNTIYKEFLESGRSLNDPDQLLRMHKHWIKCRLEDNNIKTIGVKDFIDLYKENKENHLVRIIGDSK